MRLFSELRPNTALQTDKLKVTCLNPVAAIDLGRIARPRSNRRAVKRGSARRSHGSCGFFVGASAPTRAHKVRAISPYSRYHPIRYAIPSRQPGRFPE